MTHNNGTYMFMFNSLGSIANFSASTRSLDVSSHGATLFGQVIPRGPDAPKLFGTPDWQMESFRRRLRSVGCEEYHLTGVWRWRAACVTWVMFLYVFNLPSLVYPICWHIFLAWIYSLRKTDVIALYIILTVDILAYFVKLLYFLCTWLCSGCITRTSALEKGSFYKSNRARCEKGQNRINK